MTKTVDGAGGEGVTLRCTTCAAPLRVELPRGPDVDGSCASCGATWRVRDGIVELDDAAGGGDYPAEIYPMVADVEQRHWWHASRNDVITRALAPHVEARGLRRGVEVGCGTGFVLRHVEQRFGLDVVGVDMQREGLLEARERTASPLVRTGRPLVPLADPTDLVLLCDVIEHADDDVGLLSAARDALRPGGLVLVTVPARPSLWSLEDVMSGHKRRYTRRALRRALVDAELDVVALVPFHAAITPLAWWGAKRSTIPRELPEPLDFWRAALAPPTGLLSRVVRSVLRVENAVGARVPLPFGSHLLALAQPRTESA